MSGGERFIIWCFTAKQAFHSIQCDVRQQWTDLSPYNVTKNVIDFSIAIPRERLRPNYGSGFGGAPLDASQLNQGRIDQNRGVNRDEPKTAKKEEVDRASEI
jgi:hypothetical protein